MNNITRIKQIVESCKERLKRETNPDQRYAIAVVGEEFNKLYLELNEVDNPVVRYKKCKGCKQNKPLSEYSMHQHSYWMKKTGVTKVYSYLRAKCDACTWPTKYAQRQMKRA